jgi:hypothetical protein
VTEDGMFGNLEVLLRVILGSRVRVDLEAGVV